MLPLAGSQFPGSLEDFVVALRTGFGARGIAARDIRAVGEWPHVTELSIDLTGAHFSRATDVGKPENAPQPAMFVDSLAISASPFHFEKTPARLDLHASKAECGFSRDSAGGVFVQLVRTESGSVSIEAQRSDLENALKEFAQGFLAKQGATVKSARLELIDRGPQSLGFRAEVTAKAFVMTARVVVTGRLDLDNKLNLCVRDLATSGDGMIASIATGFLRPRFAEIEQRTIPLAEYSFAGVTLHGVRISGGDSLKIEGRFGA